MSLIPVANGPDPFDLLSGVDRTLPTVFDLSSAEGWRKRLFDALTARNKLVKVCDDYYRGNHRLQFAGAKFKTAFGDLFSAFADNWCPIVVDAVEERLNVQGFRLGHEDVTGDDEAWRIWQVNQLDAYSQVAHTEALVAGEAYALVAPSSDGALITIEHASQMIVACAPSNRRQRLAALKVWAEPDGSQLCTLYLPDLLFKWKRRKDNAAWEARELPDESWPAPNPFGVVPVVPLVNRPRLLTGGESEIAQVIPLQDAVNKLVADMLVASEFGAFRQRWVTGIDIPVDPVTNQPIEPFKVSVDRLLVAEKDTAKFGEFGETDLGSYVTAVEMLVQHAASQTRTPPHYFYLRGTFPSGESIKAAETGLVAKARRKMRHFGEGWEEVMRLAFLAEGNSRGAAATRMEVIWGDPESRTESEHVDAIVKKQALGLPDQLLWEQLGMGPTEIARANVLRSQQVARDGEMSADEILDRVNSAVALVAAGYDDQASLTAVGLDPIRHLGLLPVTVQED